MLVLERPTPIGASPAGQDAERVFQSVIPGGGRFLEVIEPSEDVVVPPWRKRQTGEGRVDNASVAVRSVEAVVEKELATRCERRVNVGPDRAERGDFGQRFERQDGGVERAVPVTESYSRQFQPPSGNWLASNQAIAVSTTGLGSAH